MRDILTFWDSNPVAVFINRCSTEGTELLFATYLQRVGDQQPGIEFERILRVAGVLSA